MSEKLFCYEIEVETTNSAKDTCQSFGKYLACKNGILFVVAPDLKTLTKIIESELIKSIKNLGLAHIAENNQKQT